jgi:hypothetical protein
MEEKKKKKQVDEENTKKPEEKSHEEHNVIVTPDDLEKLLEDLKNKYNVRDENIKIVQIEGKRPPIRMLITTFLFSFLFDFLLVISLNGYLSYTSYNILRLLIFSVVFSIAEFLFRGILMKFFPKLMLYSLGLILIPISFAALILGWWVSGLEGNENLIPFFIIFLIIRFIMNALLMRRNREKILRRIGGGKNGK